MAWERSFKSASQTWKAIERLKSLIASGACFLVGDGATIDIWKDPWVPWLPCFLPKPRIESDKESLMVACLINQTSRSWNLPKLMELFYDDSVKAINKIRIPVIPHPDKLVWIPDPKGNFSVHSVYKVHTSAQSSTNQEIQWNKVWKLKLHDRLKMLLWRIGTNILPTNLNFFRRVGYGALYVLCVMLKKNL